MSYHSDLVMRQAAENVEVIIRVGGSRQLKERVVCGVRACPDTTGLSHQVALGSVRATVTQNPGRLVREPLWRINNVCLHADIGICMMAIDDFDGFPGSNDHNPSPSINCMG